MNESTIFQYSLDGVNYQEEPTFENLNFGDYIVTAVNSAGCFGELAVKVEDDNDLDVVVDERKNINCFYKDNGLIEFHVDGAQPPVSYALDGSIEISTVPRFEALSEGLHAVAITDGRGCQEELNFEIVRSYSSIDEDCPCVVYVPNAMTPDEDGVNDLFKIRPSCPITNYSIEIYDRWGKLMFASNDIEYSWNASERNGDYYAIDGLYFYKINYSWGTDFESTVNEVKTGNVLVLR